MSGFDTKDSWAEPALSANPCGQGLLGCGLILAAGFGRRLGQPKALMPWKDTDFLGACLRQMDPLALNKVVIVVNPIVAAQCGDLSHYEMATEVVVLENPEPEEGHLDSLQLGLRSLLTSNWVLTQLVDYPQTSPYTLAQLVLQAPTDCSMVVPVQGGRRGHPIIFKQEMYADLLICPKEQGPRWAVARHQHRRCHVEVDDPYIHRDIDTPEEYRQALGESTLQTRRT